MAEQSGHPGPSLEFLWSFFGGGEGDEKYYRTCRISEHFSDKPTMRRLAMPLFLHYSSEAPAQRLGVLNGRGETYSRYATDTLREKQGMP